MPDAPADVRQILEDLRAAVESIELLHGYLELVERRAARGLTPEAHAAVAGVLAQLDQLTGYRLAVFAIQFPVDADRVRAAFGEPPVAQA